MFDILNTAYVTANTSDSATIHVFLLLALTEVPDEISSKLQLDILSVLDSFIPVASDSTLAVSSCSDY